MIRYVAKDRCSITPTNLISVELAAFRATSEISDKLHDAMVTKPPPGKTVNWRREKRFNVGGTSGQQAVPEVSAGSESFSAAWLGLGHHVCHLLLLRSAHVID